ncbi:MAG: hypothetical protein HY865_21475 [Chloroflexi bacterium]|nr:hypothetical protein [Chloroflexota bacterium]
MFDSRHGETCQVSETHISGMDSATVWADRELDASTNGAGEFKGGDLHSQTAETHISGMDSATVWVDRELDVRLSPDLTGFRKPLSASCRCPHIGYV